jgi:hypothetical protein
METAESLADFAEVFGALKAALDGLPAQVTGHDVAPGD